jgi:diaminohydroxyphosphoribosylaminopyrimidine deaminase / 5-amino-6-(5-phosphoribosylamino)uracil reductase
VSETSAHDREWMVKAIGLSRNCQPSEGAYSVGAIIVDKDGQVLSTGYSREDDPKVHAEEAALKKLPEGDQRLKKATIYSTLEPCSERKSRPGSCAQLILDAGIPRVVLAWREPDLFVTDCRGIELLEQAGVEVIELPDLAEEARAVNAHLHRG